MTFHAEAYVPERDPCPDIARDRMRAAYRRRRMHRSPDAAPRRRRARRARPLRALRRRGAPVVIVQGGISANALRRRASTAIRVVGCARRPRSRDRYAPLSRAVDRMARSRRTSTAPRRRQLPRGRQRGSGRRDRRAARRARHRARCTRSSAHRTARWSASRSPRGIPNACVGSSRSPARIARIRSPSRCATCSAGSCGSRHCHGDDERRARSRAPPRDDDLSRRARIRRALRDRAGIPRRPLPLRRGRLARRRRRELRRGASAPSASSRCPNRSTCTRSRRNRCACRRR